MVSNLEVCTLSQSRIAYFMLKHEVFWRFPSQDPLQAINILISFGSIHQNNSGFSNTITMPNQVSHFPFPMLVWQYS